MFRRRSNDESVAPTSETDAGTQGKGRPTPTRKEAEAARKAALAGTTDPKAARKAEREAARQARYEAQQGLRSGDPKKLPARDQGPIKARVRDIVDGRISMGEIFIPVAVLVLVLGFVRVQAVQVALLWVWLFVLIGVVVDSLFIVWRLRRQLPAGVPGRRPVVHDRLTTRAVGSSTASRAPTSTPSSAACRSAACACPSRGSAGTGSRRPRRPPKA